MLNQLLKFTLVSSILLWLKPRWRGLLALIVLVIMVHVLHGEYLGYVELSGDRSLLIWSYVFKWIVLLFGILSYLFLSLSGSKIRPPHAMGSQAKQVSAVQSKVAVDDGFDFLRRKQRLQNRAEKIISQEGVEHNIHQD